MSSQGEAAARKQSIIAPWKEQQTKDAHREKSGQEKARWGAKACCIPLCRH